MSTDKKNPLDSKYKLPDPYKDSKKDICTLIRKASKSSSRDSIKDNEDIPQEVFKGFTDLKEIEKLIFHSSGHEYDFFVVRLYVVKSDHDTLSKMIKGFFARFLTKLGTVHLAVQINEHIIHWYDCGLVLVQPYQGSHATAVFYPQDEEGDDVPVLDNTPEVREEICKVIQRYNCEKKYNLKSCNCQHFAQDIFKVLKLKSDFDKMEGPIGDYLKYIIDKGKNSNNFACLVDSKQNVLKQGGKFLSWNTHEEMDRWCNEIDENDDDAKDNLEKYDRYKGLMKAFHRAYQMREVSEVNKMQESYKSQYCPFGRPTLLMKDRYKKIEIDPYSIEFNHSLSLKMSSTSESSGSSFSGNNN